MITISRRVRSDGQYTRLTLEFLEPRVLCAAYTNIITNPYFPMIAGTTWIYSGVNEDGRASRVVVNALHETQTIAGVQCVVAHVEEYSAGKRIENTFDYYAQDRAGNVWYFGEDTDEIEDGEIVSRAGSWHAGVDNARAGIIMPAAPSVGMSYLQEDAPGIGEDQARVVAIGVGLAVPAGRFTSTIATAETSRIEPDVLEFKYYARNVGLVSSRGVAGELDQIVLERVRFESKSAVEMTAPSQTGQSASRFARSLLDENDFAETFTAI